MEYIEIKDGKVIGHCAAAEMPNGDQYREVTNFTGIVGTPENQLSKSGELLSEQEIIASGALSPGDNECIALEKGKWILKPDFSSVDHWTKVSGRKVGVPKGIDPSDDLTTVAPPEYPCVWDESAGAWKANIPEYKDQLKREINATHTQRLAVGFEIEPGKHIQADPASQQNATGMMIKAQAGKVTYPIQWRTYENEFIQFQTFEELDAMSDQMFIFVDTEYTKAWTAKDQIEAATKESEITSVMESYRNN